MPEVTSCIPQNGIFDSPTGQLPAASVSTIIFKDKLASDLGPRKIHTASLLRFLYNL